MNREAEARRAIKARIDNEIRELQMFSNQFTESGKNRVNFLLTSIRINFEYLYNLETEAQEAKAAGD